MPASRNVIGREPIRPDRVRRIDDGGFAFVPNRFLRDGFLASLTPDELRLYLLLTIAGDRRGMSFYHYDSICSLLEMMLDEYLEARDALIEKDLLAYDGTRFQVLSLPSAPRPPRPRASSPTPEEHIAPQPTEPNNEIRRAMLDALNSK